MKSLLLLLLISTLSFSIYSQCGTTVPSFIPNPSFESRSCCPTAHSQMNCANSWIQASSATTDYLNTCGYSSTPSSLNAPTPLPDGTGFVGIYDGRNNTSTWKEYLGTCLPTALSSGTSYTLQISMAASIGSGSYTGPSNLTREFVIYGMTGCTNLPFTGSDCPANHGYSVVHSQTVTLSSSAWTTVSFTFTPTFNVKAFIFGGNCTSTTGGMNNGNGGSTNYYFIDNMILNSTVSFQPPVAEAGPTKTISCGSTSTTLNGSAASGTGPYSYAWSPTTGLSNPNIASPTASPTSTTNYTVTVTDANGCTDTDQTTVTINNTVPSVNAGANKTTTCTNPTTVLNGSASGGSTPYSYAWNNGAGTSQTPTVNPASNTTYTLTVTGANGCSATDQVTVTVNKAAPTAEAGPSFTTTCTTPTATLSGSATGGTTPYTYLWSNSAGTSQTATVNPSSTTPYTLTVTGANGCTDTDQATVTVNKTLPNANAGADINLDCATTSGTFTATGGGTYSWSTPAGTSTGSTVSVTDASVTGNYTLTVTGANGCVSTDFAVLSINQTPPVANAGADQISSCATPTVSLNGSASTGTGISYAWTGPNITGGGTTNTATADTPGTYTLTVTGSNNCTDTDQVDVNPDNNYPIADAGTDQILDCNTLSVSLDGSNSDAGSTITYSWSTSTGNITGSTSTNTTTSDLDGTYTLTVTNTSNGCSSNDNVLVSQDTVTPIVSLNSATYTIDCNNPTVTFDASMTSGIGNTYAWSTTDGNIVNGGSTATPTVNLNGTYELQATSANGCSNLSSAIVTVSIDTLSPTILIQTADTLTCLITSVNLDATNSQVGVTYNWSTNDGNIVSGSNTATPVIDSTGNYSLTITSSNGCTSIATIEVFTSPVPTTQIIANPILGEIPLDVDFSEISTGNGLTYFWEFGTGDTDSVATTSYTYTDIDTYQVYLTVIDQYGCVAIDSITIDAVEVSAVIVPNIFTPNGDGTNDIFKVTASSIKSLSAQIVNRWGQVVYEWETAAGGWDGYSASGIPSTSGTYYYFIVVEFLDGRIEEFKGPLMLKK